MIIILLGRETFIEGILRRSNNEILSLTLFKCSAKVYSSSGMTVSFCARVLPLLGTSVEGGGSWEGFPLDLVLWGCWKLKTVSGSSSYS